MNGAWSLAKSSARVGDKRGFYLANLAHSMDCHSRGADDHLNFTSGWDKDGHVHKRLPDPSRRSTSHNIRRRISQRPRRAHSSHIRPHSSSPFAQGILVQTRASQLGRNLFGGARDTHQLAAEVFAPVAGVLRRAGVASGPHRQCADGNRTAGTSRNPKSPPGSTRRSRLSTLCRV